MVISAAMVLAPTTEQKLGERCCFPRDGRPTRETTRELESVCIPPTRLRAYHGRRVMRNSANETNCGVV